MNLENYDPSFPDQPVVDLYLPVWANLPAFRSKPAFIWVPDDGSSGATKYSTLTYSQLNKSVHSISLHLLLSFQRGDTVIILCPPGLELVELIFGCQRSGLLCIPIFPPDPSFTNQNYHHLVRVLSQTNPKAAIAHPHYIASVQSYIASSSSSSSYYNHRLVALLQKLKWVSTDDIKYNNNNKRGGPDDMSTSISLYNGCKPNDVYLIQYTSGATGVPKPVLVTAGSAVHNVRLARKAYDLHPRSVIVSWLPQYHDCGLQFLLLTIVSGATCVLTSPGAFINRPRIWLELISSFEATCTPVPSFTLPLVVKRGGVDKGTRRIDLWSLKNLIIINEPIYKAAVDEFVEVFMPFGLNPTSISPSYGLAENCTFVSTAWSNKTKRTDFASFPSHKKLLPCARLASQQEEDIDIVVVNEETNELVEDGTEGEIWVSSPSNCSSYLGHPSLTREIFQARLSNNVSRCYVRTGDRGIILKGEERFLYVTGRCSDVIKLSNGQELHPHYLETAAHNSCPQFLRGGCVAAFEMSGRIALVAEMQRSEKDLRVLREICEGIKKGVMKEEGVEVGLVVLVKSSSVPKTTSGKIRRWAAKDKLRRGQMSIIMEVEFQQNINALVEPSQYVTVIRESKMRGNEGNRMIDEDIKESFPSVPNRPSLLSLL